MRHIPALLLASTVLLAPSAQAEGLSLCEVHSDYGLQLSADGLSFRRSNGAPAEIRIAAGRLWLDGQEQRLVAADRERIAALEQRLRALVPEVKAVALEGVGLAADAVGRVVEKLGGVSADAAVQRIRDLQLQIEERVDRGLAAGHWNEAEVEREVEALVAAVVPEIAGQIAAAVVSAALSGDTDTVGKLERQAEELERNLRREMAVRAAALEARTDALCPRIKALTTIIDALELRLGDGSTLPLLRR